MKILIVMLTHDKYAKLIPIIWERLLKTEVPKGAEVDWIIVTENDNAECIKYCQENNLPLHVFGIDYTKLDNYLTDPKFYAVSTKRTFRESFKIAEIRNCYLKMGVDGGYDWILQCDGDVLPPTNGLNLLLSNNKKYVGAGVESDRQGKMAGHYAHPYNHDAIVPYEVEVLGNCFHLEHRDIFVNVPYIIPDLDPSVCSDAPPRCKDIKKYGETIWCDPRVVCQHLEPDLSNYKEEK